MRLEGCGQGWSEDGWGEVRAQFLWAAAPRTFCGQLGNGVVLENRSVVRGGMWNAIEPLSFCGSGAASASP